MIEIYWLISLIGNGSFNYLPIEVKLDGIVGVNTVSGQDFQCKVQPLFRGSIQSVDLTDNGVAYGSSEIINFNRQPNISFNSGKDAQLTPIVSNSRIVDIIVNDGGSGTILLQILLLQVKVNLQNLHQSLRVV